MSDTLGHLGHRYPILNATDLKVSKILLIVVLALHAGLAIAIKILFFAYVLVHLVWAVCLPCIGTAVQLQRRNRRATRRAQRPGLPVSSRRLPLPACYMYDYIRI